MVTRSTTSEYQPAPPFYRNQGKTSQTPGAANNEVALNAPKPSNMQAPSRDRHTDALGNRVTSGGLPYAPNQGLSQPSLKTSINPSGD